MRKCDLSLEAEKLMHANWEYITKRWPRYQVDESDASIIDASECVFVGNGNHEFAVYSFRRYVRSLTNESRYPICIRFGIHFPEFVADEEPAIAHLRTRFSNDLVGLVEPVQLLAIIACDNGPAFWDTLWTELGALPRLDNDTFQHERWVSANVTKILEAATVVQNKQLPKFVSQPTPDVCGVSISLADLPAIEFPGYEPCTEELSSSRTGSWAYEMKKAIKRNGNGKQSVRERVILREDLRRIDDTLHKGQLGWTNPSPGFSIKKGGTSLRVSVPFDSGVQVTVDVHWIDFLREEYADSVARKIVEFYRGTPFDADSSMALRWECNHPFFKSSETKIVGRGLDEVYAYTYMSCVREASLAGEPYYPMKIGYTSGVHGALQRIHGQFPQALADDVRVQFIGRCSEGRQIEGKLHKHIRDAGRKLESAPGREWYLTTAAEVEELFLKHRS